LRRIAELEREVERAEAEFKQVEDELADPSHWASPTSSARATARHAAARKALDDAFARWEEATTAAGR
jgi:ATP-binding cassette subfamily F protein 3